MRIKTLVSAIAIALAASVGAASAADQFATLEGIAADALTPQEMGVVFRAAAVKLNVNLPGSAVGPTTNVRPVTLILGIQAATQGIAHAVAAGAVPAGGGSSVAGITP